jgi:hypothetical protein
MSATLDQYGVKDHDTSGYVALTGTHTAGTWYDIGIGRGDVPSNGIYIAHVFADTHLLGVTQYSTEAVSEPFFMTSSGSNSVSRSLIQFSKCFTGHAPNSYTDPNSMFEFGYLHKNGGVAQELQIKFNNTMTFTNASGRMFRISMYRYK